jgi:hypothetical protein
VDDIRRRRHVDAVGPGIGAMGCRDFPARWPVVTALVTRPASSREPSHTVASAL